LSHVDTISAHVRHGGVGKFSDFLYLSMNISKTFADTAKVTIND